MIRATHFAVHVLRDTQAALAMNFAESGTAFDDTWRRNTHNVPVLDDCLCRFECHLLKSHEAGDHSILIGQVEQIEMRDGNPLLFAQGRFGDFSASV